MDEKFSVAISYKESLGYVEYDDENAKVNVVLADDEGRRKAEDFLTAIHEINIPHETLLDFTAEKINPQADVESLKIALTRLWEATGVHVDWSRPVDYVKLHPHY
ncbi:MAG: hypothetical protein IJS81_12580 [Selenomonadaceae bacterium]|nr:hypothetical protein [Selenomonadaceae bacterium]MBQ7631026.1 hypothetical protein [Selenomonadaceae bacterium]